MKIYVSHTSSYDYKRKLYKPLRSSPLNKLHEIILPHEKSKEPINSKEIIPTCDLVIAEVSHPSTGQGMELAWTDYNDIPLIGIYLKGSIISNSIKVLAKKIIEYNDEKDLISKLSKVIKEYEK